MEQNKKSPYKKNGMFDEANHLVFQFAKDLRKNMTDAEKILWNHLKSGIQGFKFRRQHPLGLYVADFYCHRIKFIIELDGSIHNLATVQQNDEQRQRNLESAGFTIIRFDNDEVIKEVGSVLIRIEAVVNTLSGNQNYLRNK